MFSGLGVLSLKSEAQKCGMGWVMLSLYVLEEPFPHFFQLLQWGIPHLCPSLHLESSQGVTMCLSFIIRAAVTLELDPLSDPRLHFMIAVENPFPGRFQIVTSLVPGFRR